METTIEQLQERIKALEEENTFLKIHSPYGILTRAGLELEKRSLDSAQYAVFADIDDMHGLNARHGYENVNQMIREALQLRSDDLLLTGLWFSGDEIVFVIKSPADGFMKRVRESFAARGMGITLAAATIENNDLNRAIDHAARRVQALKTNRKGKRND